VVTAVTGEAGDAGDSRDLAYAAFGAAVIAGSAAVAARGPYAGVVTRGLALGIDLVIATVGTTVASAGVRLFGSAIGSGQWEAKGATVLAFVLALPVVFVLYCAAFWTLLGRTPGKAALGLRVVDRDGSRPHFARALVRALGYSLSAIFLIGFAWAAVDAHHQALHDKLAGTYVRYA
jgi:uncharacterized RDD family membrane protein YckC